MWREKGSHQSPWTEGKILDKEEPWRVRHLKESVHMLDYENLLSRPSIEINMKWEPLIKREKH